LIGREVGYFHGAMLLVRWGFVLILAFIGGAASITISFIPGLFLGQWLLWVALYTILAVLMLTVLQAWRSLLSAIVDVKWWVPALARGLARSAMHLGVFLWFFFAGVLVLWVGLYTGLPLVLEAVTPMTAEVDWPGRVALDGTVAVYLLWVLGTWGLLWMWAFYFIIRQREATYGLLRRVIPNAA